MFFLQLVYFTDQAAIVLGVGKSLLFFSGRPAGRERIPRQEDGHEKLAAALPLGG